MLLAITIVMALGLMVLAYQYKRPAMALGGSGAWLVAAVTAYIASAALWDAYYGMFWFCVLMIVVAAFEALYCKEKKSEPEEEKKSEWDNWIDDMETRRDKYDRIRALRRTGTRTKRRRESNYEKTGKPD